MSESFLNRFALALTMAGIILLLVMIGKSVWERVH
jgi:hypothetical protein